jgi:two-component sensor histidine kinase
LSVWNSANPIAEDFAGTAKKATGLGLVTTLAQDIYGGEFTLKPHQGGTLATVILPDEKLRL